MMRALEMLTAPMRRRINLMIGRALVHFVDDAASMQNVQIELFDGEVRDAADRLQNYGFTSVPLPGSEAAVACVGGNRDHPLVIVVDDRRYRLHGLQNGEVAIYTDEGDKIHLKRGGTVQVVAATKLEIVSPVVTMSGNLDVAGDITAQGDIYDHGNESMLGMRQVYNSHTHSDPQGGIVSTPSGQM